MNKKLWGAMLSFLLIMLFASPRALADGDIYIGQVNFIDIQQNFWASDAINAMSQSGVVHGYPDKTYKPANPVSREEFATMIAKSFYLDLPGKTATPTFYDVPADRWSFPYVEASKDFLTGFYPPSGHAFFSPTMNATREDVAVALVKVMGYTPDDLEDPNILEEKFSDAEQISPNLLDDVALAVEKKLFSGYPDGTFQPNRAVNRAEVASLLYRVIKSSTADGQKDITLNVSAPDTTTDGTVYITGDTTPGAKVTINDQPVDVIQGHFTQGFKLDQEGTFPFTVVARIAGGKTKQVTKQVTYQHGGPQIDFSNLPETTDKQTITITGTVSDPADPSPKLYLNDQLISSDWSDQFQTQVNLQEGANTLTFTATNAFGKTTTVTKTITLALSGPKLQLGMIPTTTSSSNLTISGSVTDSNDSYPKVYLNGSLLNQWSNSFTDTITLQEGENVLNFTATDSAGQQTSITKTVTFNGGAPTLQVNNIPDTTTSQTLQVSWTVKDSNDAYPQVYVNDELMSYYTNSTTLKLTEGTNTITFKATNKLGKTTVVTKTVTLTSGAPVLTVNYVPSTTSTQKLQVSWTVKDSNDPNPQVYVNDQLMSYYQNSTMLTLQPGDNMITFVATNNLGKSTTVTKTVTFTNNGPSLTLGYLPDTSKVDHVQLTWNVSDANDSYPQLYVNDQLVSYGNSQNMKLEPGENTITVRVVDKLGQSTTQTKTVIFDPPAPVLTVGYVPESTNSTTLQLTWTVRDSNDLYPNVYVNDELIQYGTSKTISLNVGSNTIVIKATDKYGQEVTVTKTITRTE